MALAAMLASYSVLDPLFHADGDDTSARTGCRYVSREPDLAANGCRDKILYAGDDDNASVPGWPSMTAASDGTLDTELTNRTDPTAANTGVQSTRRRQRNFSAFAVEPGSVTARTAERGLGLTVFGQCQNGLDRSGIYCRRERLPGDAANADVTFLETHSISGRILGEDGLGIAGIAVVAKPIRLYDSNGSAPGARGPDEYHATSDSLGFYAFRGLPEGDFEIRTSDHGAYPSVRTTVRSGIEYADLVLREEHQIFVEGRVLTETGEPLEGVTVLPIVVGVPSVLTNDFGEYRLPIAVRPEALNLKLRFQRPGFRESYLTVQTPQLGSPEQAAPDTIMDTVEYWTAVTGTVSRADGAPFQRRNVELRPIGEQRIYTAETDADGKFRFPAVEAPLPYRLYVSGGVDYKDFREQVRITADEAQFDITVDPYEFGELNGRLVNLDGAPVPDFNLVLRNTASKQPNAEITSDRSGNFSVPEAPAGELVAASQSMPSFLVRGLHVDAGAELDVPLVLDWGEHEIHGIVLDRFGHPVPASRILLKWSHESDGISSTSTRRTAADAQGNFQFSELGPGPHSLLVDAAGFATVALNHDASRQGYDLTVRLN